jgi:hypothetical protein
MMREVPDQYDCSLSRFGAHFATVIVPWGDYVNTRVHGTVSVLSINYDQTGYTHNETEPVSSA